MRDRRAVMSALIMPIVGPVTIAAMLTVIAGWMRQDKPLKMPVQNAERAPNLIEYLKRNSVEIEAATANPEDKVRDGTYDLVLTIPQDYAEDFTEGHTAHLELLVDNSRNKARSSVVRAQRLLRQFSTTLGSLRLLARGVSPSLANPVQIDEVDLSTPEKLAAQLLGSVPIFLLMAVFMAGMYLAIDATAGERERGSLEPLLVNPVTRMSVVIGKWAAGVTATWLGLSVALVGFGFTISRVPLQDLGVKLQLGLSHLGWLLALLIPLSLLASGVQIAMSLYARSFKEAQTYLSLLMILPVVPATVSAISPSDPKAWMMFVPVLAQSNLLSEVMRGEPLKLSWVLAAAVMTVLAAGVCLRIAVALLSKEKIVFGRSSA
ncbi:MAG: ABC transporter permease [Deltaproteobacteria bacterium]|nr:ABC transporter permease [Deltaproteobacteria bacterium]